MNPIKKFYEDKYKLLLLLPFIILLAALIQIGLQYSATGDFVNKGISLKGGSTITLPYSGSFNVDNLRNELSSNFQKADITVRTIHSAGEVVAIAIDTDAEDEQEISSVVKILEKETGLSKNDFSIEIVGSSLGESFFKQTAMALLIAFLLMGLVVFIYFRSIAPSMAVILAAFSDIVVTLAVFNLTGERLSTAGIAAFLMLIGYSVDTDILLSTRVLKRTELTVMERVYSAMKTGFTMTGTTLIAVLVALLFVQSDIIKQIVLIIFIGLIVDLIMTWIQNVGILRLYLERKGHRK
ncbi:MAG: protein translocase subunit SecF [archaeon]|nr:protein translocase subunit SecF [archaeon]